MNNILRKDYLSIFSDCRGSQLEKHASDSICGELNLLFDDVAYAHPWFIRHHIDYAFLTLIETSDKEDINPPSIRPPNNKSLAFWMRPESPFDGIELIISGIHAGFRCVIKTNETDRSLYRGILGLLQERFPGMKERVELVDHPFGEVDAFVIVGENPTPSQLDYLKRKPVFMDTADQDHALAVLTGNENSEELDLLATDLCMYFGRSRYNTAELLVPEGYNFDDLLTSVENYRSHANHSRYYNHYEYRKAAFMVSGEAFIDNGFLLFIKGKQLARHVGVVNYSEYESSDLQKLNFKGNQIFKAKPTIDSGELAFGSALLQHYLSVDRFPGFIKGVIKTT